MGRLPAADHRVGWQPHHFMHEQRHALRVHLDRGGRELLRWHTVRNEALVRLGQLDPAAQQAAAAARTESQHQGAAPAPYHRRTHNLA